MKTTPYLLTALFLISFIQVHAQVSNDMQAIHMIKDFYTDYCSLTSKPEDINKRDSLINKYCTPEEASKVKEEFNKGHDIMTNDSGINTKSLEFIFIKKISDRKALNIETGKYEIDKGVKYAYEVSYMVNPPDLTNNGVSASNNVLIDILVVRYNDVIKIAYVTNGLTNNLRYSNHKE